MSIMSGTKPSPNSLCKRSASACLRTEPNTRNPFETSTFVVPQPIPVETPVTTTSLLFAIAFLLRWITVHLQYLQWLPKTRLKRASRELVSKEALATGGQEQATAERLNARDIFIDYFFTTLASINSHTFGSSSTSAGSCSAANSK